MLRWQWFRQMRVTFSHSKPKRAAVQPALAPTPLRVDKIGRIFETGFGSTAQPHPDLWNPSGGRLNFAVGPWKYSEESTMNNEQVAPETTVLR